MTLSEIVQHLVNVNEGIYKDLENLRRVSHTRVESFSRPTKLNLYHIEHRLGSNVGVLME